MNLIYKVRTPILNIREQPVITSKVIRQVTANNLIASPAHVDARIRDHYQWRQTTDGYWFAVGGVDARNELVLCNQLAVFHEVQMDESVYQVSNTELFDGGQLFSWRQVDIASPDDWLIQAIWIKADDKIEVHLFVNQDGFNKVEFTDIGKSV